MGLIKIVLLSMTSVFLIMLPAFGAGQHMMQPRVPADKLDEARALTNPLKATPEILAKGKTLYEGKGTCFNCHGMSGRGDGPGAATLNPPPRVFKSHGFWKHRTEGEIFWVIKHGSPGTAMISFSGLLSDEEIWSVMLYERSFAGGRGHGGGRHGASGMKGGQGRHQGSDCKGEQEMMQGRGMQGHQDGDCQSQGMGHHKER
ncbi:c-type cytochrome [Candidatus Nitronereus thalassa]|uniref:C-type cytochrome n=1 Tax=Candidatus Nitronereus thalassa TaxID=3020898 RepID=A0ABU3K7T4_9BACT|nr:c-type cytochrome [Candidatus Nitronereus thalassa]MDT7042383.1 c-type cytochrome [Candidatus Nitronereus thalassa]